MKKTLTTQDGIPITLKRASLHKNITLKKSKRHRHRYQEKPPTMIAKNKIDQRKIFMIK